MCDPVSAVAALSIASTVVGVVGQAQAASAQEDANSKQYDASMQAMRENYAQTDLQQQQAAQQAGQKMFENRTAATQARSTAVVQAGEGGVSGLSVDALLGDIDTRQATYDSSIESNLKNTSAALNNQRSNVRTSAASQINSLKAPVQPDYIGAALRIGGTGADGYQKYQSRKAG